MRSRRCATSATGSPREASPARRRRPVRGRLDRNGVLRGHGAVVAQRRAAHLRLRRRRARDVRHPVRVGECAAEAAPLRLRARTVARGPSAGEGLRPGTRTARGDARRRVRPRPAHEARAGPARDSNGTARAQRPAAVAGDRRALVGPAAARPRAAGRQVRPRDRIGRSPRVHRRSCEDRLMDLADVGRRCDRILDEVERAVIGKRDALELLQLGLLADGHILIEDFPGLAKTLMARSFAQSTSLAFSRIQFTPDLMPSDVTGSSIYNQRDALFQFRPGPIFANLLLADEINRAPPKTQAALLEAMQERQVTTEGETRVLERPFLVLATQNPIEYEGTYPLPEAQLDRFLLRMSVGYPDRAHEWEVLERRVERKVDEVELACVVDRATLLEMQRATENVHVSEPVGYYMVDVVKATRESTRVQVGA